MTAAEPLGRIKENYFIFWLNINKPQPQPPLREHLYSWDTCLGPEGVPWIEVPWLYFWEMMIKPFFIVTGFAFTSWFLPLLQEFVL